MFDTIANRPALSIASFLRALVSGLGNRTAPRGPMPTWIDDPELRAQMLRDTGLTLDDITGQPRYDERKPFFMQQDLR